MSNLTVQDAKDILLGKLVHTGHKTVEISADLDTLLAARDAEVVTGDWRANEGNPGTGWWLEKFDGYWRSYIGALDERTAIAYASALNRADRYLEGTNGNV